MDKPCEFCKTPNCQCDNAYIINILEKQVKVQTELIANYEQQIATYKAIVALYEKEMGE